MCTCCITTSDRTDLRIEVRAATVPYRVTSISVLGSDKLSSIIEELICSRFQMQLSPNSYATGTEIGNLMHLKHAFSYLQTKIEEHHVDGQIQAFSDLRLFVSPQKAVFGLHPEDTAKKGLHQSKD